MPGVPNVKRRRRPYHGRERLHEKPTYVSHFIKHSQKHESISLETALVSMNYLHRCRVSPPRSFDDSAYEMHWCDSFLFEVPVVWSKQEGSGKNI